MLEFYYDFLDRYFDRRDFELIQMDTDSNYMAISAEKLEDIVKPEAKKQEWLAWDKWSSRTPGLFKLECEGSRMIALCSKCYFVDEPEGEKNKFSTKGMPKKQNEITWQRFRSPLDGSKDMATSIWFSHEQREDGYVRTAEAGGERLLRQTLGIGRRHSHRTDRVSWLDCRW